MSASAGTLLLATVRTTIAGYLSDLIWVYILLIFAYIVLQLFFAFGARPAYSRTGDTVMGFLRDVCEPYLRIFRRLIPGVAGFDFSPMIGILLLVVVNEVIVHDLIHG
jgi:YggT family protein